MKIELYKTITVSVDIKINFPIYREKLEGEYGFADYKKTFWKFDSFHKAMIIIEEMSQTTIKTYDDPNFNWVKEFSNEHMLEGNSPYDIITSKEWDRMTSRLVNTIAKGI